jgi:hypothetical protein
MCPYVCEIESRSCLTTTVEDLIKENNIKIDFNFLLMDLQGAELDALKGISDELLKKIDYIYTEVEYIPLYTNQPLANDIIDYLEKKNFKFEKFFPEGPSRSGYAFFIKNK